VANGTRSPEEIRASIEQNRQELGQAIQRLQSEFKEATDWRKQLRAKQQQFVIGAAVAGFVIGGGVGGITGLFRRKKKPERW
jgi:multidrug resistance efflux pump